MPTKLGFRNYDSLAEQDLVERLVTEAIAVHGVDVYYIKRDVLNRDNVIVDDKLSKFSKAFPIAIYIKSVDGFGGDGTFLSKFGLEVRDQITLTLAKREFKLEIMDRDVTFSRPREGDLIYIPYMNKMFEIKYADYKPTMYQLGTLPAFDLTCESFEYNNEEYDTGFDLLDQIFAIWSRTAGNSPFQLVGPDGTPILDNEGNPIGTEGGDPVTGDTQSQNANIQSEGLKFLDFSEKDPFSEGENY